MKRGDLRIACEKYMGFTEEELQERINSGKKYKIVDRLQWATYYLLKAGLLARPDHATDQITEQGKFLVDSGVTAGVSNVQQFGSSFSSLAASTPLGCSHRP